MPEVSSDQVVTCERLDDHVVLVTIDREEARNAVDEHVARQLGDIVDRVENDAGIRVAILTGAGDKAFCAGADLKAISAGKLPQLMTAEGGFAGFVKRKRSKLWIAAVNGPAMAGGLEVLLACDFAIAADHAVFALPEVKRGLIASAGGLFRLGRSVSRGTALRMIATGEPIGAAEACARGLVDQVVARTELRATVLRIAATVAANAPLAVLESLAIARTAGERAEADLWEASEVAQGRIVLTEDFTEGPLAFAQKRPPRWLGR